MGEEGTGGAGAHKTRERREWCGVGMVRACVSVLCVVALRNLVCAPQEPSLHVWFS